jgi:hypothetical protein
MIILNNYSKTLLAACRTTHNNKPFNQGNPRVNKNLPLIYINPEKLSLARGRFLARDVYRIACSPTSNSKRAG